VHDLLALPGPTRTTSTTALSTTVGDRSIGRWIASGRLVRLHPGWVTIPEPADDWTVRAHAVAGYPGGPLSHISALALHRVIDAEVTRLHRDRVRRAAGAKLPVAAGAPQPESRGGRVTAAELLAQFDIRPDLPEPGGAGA
jgi:hypothetical protein